MKRIIFSLLLALFALSLFASSVDSAVEKGASYLFDALDDYEESLTSRDGFTVNKKSLIWKGTQKKDISYETDEGMIGLSSASLSLSLIDDRISESYTLDAALEGIISYDEKALAAIDLDSAVVVGEKSPLAKGPAPKNPATMTPIAPKGVKVAPAPKIMTPTAPKGIKIAPAPAKAPVTEKVAGPKGTESVPFALSVEAKQVNGFIGVALSYDFSGTDKGTYSYITNEMFSSSELEGDYGYFGSALDEAAPFFRSYSDYVNIEESFVSKVEKDKRSEEITLNFKDGLLTASVKVQEGDKVLLDLEVETDDKAITEDVMLGEVPTYAFLDT